MVLGITNNAIFIYSRIQLPVTKKYIYNFLDELVVIVNEKVFIALEKILRTSKEQSTSNI